MNLADVAAQKDNNWNLIRVVAASSVLVAHSFLLVDGNVFREPFQRPLSMTLGDMSVDIFFLASGFLVTKSVVNRPLAQFALARFLRVWPALIYAVLAAVLMGAVVTTEPLASYFTSPATAQYVAHNLTLFAGTRNALPGVFEHLPLSNFVNGSLWTLTFEVDMYLLLTLIFALSAAFGPFRQRIRLLIVPALVCLSFIAAVTTHAHHHLTRLTIYFFVGSSFYLYRKYIMLDWRAMTFFCVALIAAGLAGPKAFAIAFPLCVPYALFWVAYVPSGSIRRYNELGDYSYGIYIFAFPVQQLLVFSFPGIGPFGVMALASAATLPLAILSWHLVEQRALKFKGIDFAGRFGAKSA